MAASTLFYLGLVVALMGVVVIVHPVRRLRLRTRRQGVVVLALGVLTACGAWLAPTSETRITTPQTRLDSLVSAYQFGEYHATHVAASPAQVYRAMEDVTADEILLFRTLTFIRRFGRGGSESILNPSGGRPILDVATHTGFATLAAAPPEELVIGVVFGHPELSTAPDATAAFAALNAPGTIKAAMNFRIEPEADGGSRVSTETRVFATDPEARRDFAKYWRVIYPGSALIRRGWLRAIERRAERLAP